MFALCIGRHGLSNDLVGGNIAVVRAAVLRYVRYSVRRAIRDCHDGQYKNEQRRQRWNRRELKASGRESNGDTRMLEGN